MGRARQSPRRLGFRRRRSLERYRVHDGTHPLAGKTSQARHPSATNDCRLQLGWRRNGPTGSTEWGEQFADELRKKAVAYINVDSSTSGPNFHGQAVASLAPTLVETARTLQDPSGKSLYEAWKESSARERHEAKRTEDVTDANLADTRIGSGSDHTVFLNFVGMPVLGLQFDGPYGVYHSAYDDFFWMNHFGDPGYRYHTLMTQLWGVLALRLANADLLPFDFASYADNIRQFVNELEKGKDDWGKDKAIWGQPPSAVQPGEARPVPPLDLKPVLDAIDNFEAAGNRLDDSAAHAIASGAIDPKLRRNHQSWRHASRTQLAQS